MVRDWRALESGTLTDVPLYEFWRDAEQGARLEICLGTTVARRILASRVIDH